jgi:adenine-specific DNA-methyltransferase
VRRLRFVEAALDTPQLRKARGAFFTPPEVTRYVCEWAIRSPSERVYEPSCGEADFLLAAGQRLRDLGTVRVNDQLHGAELHPESAAEALGELSSRDMAAAITVGDFFDVPLEDHTYDAVVGNPPYVRFQSFSGEARAKAQRAALRAGVRLSGLASSWAAFTIRSAQILKPEGRLGLVLPAELLSTNYAGPVRRYLCERFGSVRLIMFDERVFPGVLAEVVLLLAEGCGPTDVVKVSQARNLGTLADPPVTHWRPVDPEAKWTPALLPTPVAEVYAGLLAADVFTGLEAWGSTDLGMVTGNNRFFCISAKQADRRGLHQSDLIPISPPGSRHLRGLTFTRRAWRELASADRAAYLFSPRAGSGGPISAAAAAYIAEGERAGVAGAYKCRVRAPWWQVPQVGTPDLLLTYMNHDTPRLIRNEARVTYLNSVHGVNLRPGLRQLGRELLPVGVLNSLTMLGAELTGRAYGGGVLKVEPKEAAALPVPTADVLEAAGPALSALRPQLARHMRNAELDPAVQLVDRVLLVEHLGMNYGVVEQLHKARETLFARRRARGAG